MKIRKNRTALAENRPGGSFRRHRRLTMLAGAALSIGALTAFAPGASAATSTCAHINGGYACFNRDGDFFSATDSASDGLSVVTYWSTDYGRTGSCVNRQGAGTRVTCNENLAEGHVVRLRVALLRGSTEVAKSDVVYDYS